MIFSLGDQKINQLILKWANQIDGTWADVAKDLIEYTELVIKEERENVKKEQKQIDKVI